MSNVGRKLAHLFTIPINLLSSVTEEGGFIASIAVAFFGSREIPNMSQKGNLWFGKLAFV